MQLTLQSHNTRDVVVIRCSGRIVIGEETKFLQGEVNKLTEETKRVVLHLAEVNYVDSGGLGALVRLRGMLQAAKGDLKLCQLSSFVAQVLKATNLLSVFHPYASEAEAIESFFKRSQISDERFQVKSNRIICLDTSPEVLAYLKAVLQRSGYQVFTSQYPSDAVALLVGARSSIVILGPGMRTNEVAIAKIRQSAPNAQVLPLPPDFSTSEADRAGPELVNRVRSLFAPSGT
jgi:anti-sigma B factor antagonist